MRLLACFLVACAALFAAPLTRVTLVDAGRPLAEDGSSYVGPYTLNPNSRDVAALCIDFLDEVQVGDQWAAYVSPLEGDLADTYHSDKARAYEEEAYLYTLIIQPGSDRVDLQHAAWSITDANYETDAAAERRVSQAAQDYRTIDFAKFVIISEAPGQKGSRSQEFVTVSETAEPSCINLMAGLMAISVALLGRKRGRF
jgi:hypothetical protein